MTSADDFPVAQVEPVPPKWWRNLSRMWIATFGCLLVAVVLVWFSREPAGTEISIRFAEGHGLKPGDSMRYRGINVGAVTRISLHPDLGGIQVWVELDPAAEKLAREGTRFWIVRPELALTGVSGLETAVGAKYIGVVPGNSEQPKTHFDGIESRPPSSLMRSGIEVVLRGDQRYGVNPGSPVLWRGVEVGEVISADISPDALHVDVRVRIEDKHRRLLSRNSKFWATSGIKVDMGMSGLELETGTLDTIARGGVSFVTPGSNDPDEPARSGDMYTLHDKADDDWFESPVALTLTKQSPPVIASVVRRWEQKHFGIKRKHTEHASALTFDSSSGPKVILPSDLALPHEHAVEGTNQLWFETPDGSELAIATQGDAETPLSVLEIQASANAVATFIPHDRFRQPEQIEDCLVIRHSSRSPQDEAILVETIGQHEFSLAAGKWICHVDKFRRDTWHGAAVLSTADEKIIGVLVVDKDEIAVAPILNEWFQ